MFKLLATVTWLRDRWTGVFWGSKGTVALEEDCEIGKGSFDQGAKKGKEY